MRSYDWWDYGIHSRTTADKKSDTNQIYINELKYYAMFQGIDPETIDELLNEGLTPDEVEEYLYAC